MTARPRAPHPAGVRSGAHRRPILIGLMMTMALSAVDTTIVSTAIPQVVRDLGGFTLFSWVFSSYLLTQTVTIPIYGKLADQWGTQADPDRRVHHLPGRVRTMRVVVEHDQPDLLPRGTGPRGRLDQRHREHAGRRPVRARGAGPRPGLAVQRVGHLRGVRPDARRVAGPVLVVAVDLPDQPADRR